MKLLSDSGLWSTGPVVAPSPLQAVLEISGAVLSWTVDEPSTDPQITFTDVSRADWLWQVLGESGHHALASAVGDASPHDAQAVDLTGVHVLPGSLDPLRRLAFGHWLRRWWPASHRDGIAALDAALLDAEIAILTAGAEDFFSDDTFDSDVAEILRPHVAALGPMCTKAIRASSSWWRSAPTSPTRWASRSTPPSTVATGRLRARGGRRNRPHRLDDGRVGGRIGSVVGGARRHLRCGRGHRRLEHRSRR